MTERTGDKDLRERLLYYSQETCPHSLSPKVIKGACLDCTTEFVERELAELRFEKQHLLAVCAELRNAKEKTDEPGDKDLRWRVGRNIPTNVYEGPRPVCQTYTALDAKKIVEAVNAECDANLAAEAAAFEKAAQHVPIIKSEIHDDLGITMEFVGCSCGMEAEEPNADTESFASQWSNHIRSLKLSAATEEG